RVAERSPDAKALCLAQRRRLLQVERTARLDDPLQLPMNPLYARIGVQHATTSPTQFFGSAVCATRRELDAELDFRRRITNRSLARPTARLDRERTPPPAHAAATPPKPVNTNHHEIAPGRIPSESRTIATHVGCAQ